ncbi:hypothetical protein [Streptomyces goshikiensis]|uniref:hypothetical protein n=1 Tax=Streptomyces goshikiensis TaxID=1942 RepID=UPI003824E61E
MNRSTIPPVWFRLPPGFYDIGPGDRDPLDRIAEFLGSTDARRDIAQLMDRFDELAVHQVVHTSIGLHPDDLVGISTSLFSLTIRRVEHPNPRATVAQTALDIAQSALWISSECRLIDLPSSLPCCLVAGCIAPPGEEQHLFQARVVTAHPNGQHVLILDLTSAATQHSGSYISVLEAITHTISFSDPTLSPSNTTGTSRILEVLL